VVETASQAGCAIAMAFQTQSLHVRQVAFASSFRHRNDVMRVPKRLAAFETPIKRSLNSRRSAQSADSLELCQTIQAASSAYAMVALEDALPQMPGIAAQFPLLDAPV